MFIKINVIILSLIKITNVTYKWYLRKGIACHMEGCKTEWCNHQKLLRRESYKKQSLKRLNNLVGYFTLPCRPPFNHKPTIYAIYPLIYMEASESKWVNPILDIIGVNSLRLGGLHIVMHSWRFFSQSIIWCRAHNFIVYHDYGYIRGENVAFEGYNKEGIYC